MPASYPTSSKSFTTKSPGGTVGSAHMNDVQLEITAIEDDLIAGLPVARGGTGNTSITANRIPYGNGTGALQTSANLTFNGTVLTVSGFGTHTFSAGGTGANVFDIRNTSAGTSNYAMCRVGNDTSVGALELRALSSTYTTAGNLVQNAASVDSTVAGGLSIAATHASGMIRFYSGGTTKRGEFEADGKFVLNSTGVAGGVTIVTTIASRTPLAIQTTANAVNAFVSFYNAAGSEQGSISQVNSTTIAFNTTSDQRLKNDLGLVSDVSVLRTTKVHDFEWKPNGEHARGVFAQEAIAVAPHAVTKGDDGETVITPWSVDYSKYVPDLIVGWQQHEARLKALEAKVG